MRYTELLAPAKNLECGIAAINHGADAVYIGASQFGARVAAGNSLHDIEELVKYAHQYRSKVYVALNTVLTDNQLPEAEKLIKEIYHGGADALIVQDMGILQLDIPPIALHASTQMDNRTVEKVKFLQEVGFSRVVLARELSLQQMTEIAQYTQVELEAFVHGALCVSYSGQCYISQAMCGRSANRGQCAQYCRLPYQLINAEGSVLAKQKHFLSLKDLDLSSHLEQMMKAGVMSFKIEGRLKDIDYVKNITAYYRKKLDAILHRNPDFTASSLGTTKFFFEPHPEKSFRRSSTDYFLNGRQREIFQPETPKSLGEPIGKVTRVNNSSFELENGSLLNNGDGLCFINKQEQLTGFRVNRVEGATVFPAEMPRLSIGVMLYRNQDQVFEKVLKAKTSERKVAVDMTIRDHPTGFILTLSDEAGVSSELNVFAEKTLAKKPEGVEENLRVQLSKLGNTIYEMRSFEINFSSPWFIPASQLSEWRRQLVEQLEKVRDDAYVRELPAERHSATFPLKKLTYLGNVTNRLAKQFYAEHGVNEIQMGFEVQADESVPLMFTKHCIKYEMGWCPREGFRGDIKEPLYLKNNAQYYELRFNCAKCEMEILMVGNSFRK